MLQAAELAPAATLPDLTIVAHAAAEPLLRRQVRVWVSGAVVLEPRDCPMQMQPFADWSRSDLHYDVTYDGEPPAGYTGVDYVPLRKRHFPSREFGPSMYEDGLRYPPPEDN